MWNERNNAIIDGSGLVRDPWGGYISALTTGTREIMLLYMVALTMGGGGGSNEEG